MRRHRLAWGEVEVIVSPGRGNEPVLRDRRFAFPVGRPRFMGVEHEARGEAGFAETLLDRLDQSSERGVALSLTGMGVAVVAEADGLKVITDRMGSRPIYVGYGGAGEVRSVGSHLESVASASGRAADFDLVSLGELIIHNYVSFPFTSRGGVFELEPGSVTVIRGDGIRAETRSYWRPIEPRKWPGEDECRDRLVGAMAAAGADVTRGCAKVAVTLSGGKDSRAVMGTIPRDRLAAGLTYCTRENRETDVARRVAESFGVPQVLVRRDPDFYGRLLRAGSALLGTELRADAHGICIAEAGLGNAFDLVLGGQLSDTLLKDHFMQRDRRDRLVKKPIEERLKAFAKSALGIRRGGPLSAENTLGRESAAWALKAEVREQVEARRAERLARVSECRPVTGSEWFRFWPVSRQDDSGHTLGNSRLMPSDTLFLHNAILEVACELSPEVRVGDRVADLAFASFYGESVRIENANTGLPLTASVRQRRKHERRMWRDSRAKAEFKRLPASSHPWNDVQGSWVDSGVLQRESPDWRAYRTEVLASRPALDVLDEVLAFPAREIVAAYDARLPATANQMVIQLGLVIGSLGSPGGESVGAMAAFGGQER